MTKETQSQPFAAQTLYDNFNIFIAHYEKTNTWRRFDTLPIQMLVRLARNDIEKAKRVYDWAVRVPCLCHLGGWYREHDDTKVSLSENGRKQVEIAASRFGQNPMFALTMVEGILILERTAIYAERQLAKHGVDTSADKLRARPTTPEEEREQPVWLRELYETVTNQVMYDLRDYIGARDTAIMLSITALADGCAPTEAEIGRMMRGRPHSRQSAKNQRHPITRKELPISDPPYTVKWVQGRNQKNVPF